MSGKLNRRVVQAGGAAFVALCSSLFRAFRAPRVLKEKIRRLTRLLADKEAEIVRLRGACAKLEAQLVATRNRDEPTGLPNRVRFMQALRMRLADPPPPLTRPWVVAVRLRQLEQLAHSLGSSTAAQLMRQAAERLRPLAGGGASIARISDLELGLVLFAPNERSPATLARSLLAAVDDEFRVAGRRVYLHAVLGLTSSAGDQGDVSELLDNASLAAEQALSRAERWAVYRDEAQRELITQLQLDADLRMAIGNNGLKLHFQPIVSVAEGTIVGFEALLRWLHPNGSLIMPQQIIPLAESGGHMTSISEWVLRSGVESGQRWLPSADGKLYLSMNLTPRDLNPQFCDMILRLVETAGVAPESIGVEVTETAVVRDFKVAARLINELSERGVRVLLDDFGTGYSSLSYLRQLPFHCVKIDKSFVHRMAVEARDFGLVRSIVSLVHYLGMECVAEGIETQEQLDLITMIDCNYWQGNFFSPPVPEAQAEDLLQRSAPVISMAFNVPAS